jgi:DNA-directed RNA polymerase specialized sigma24 family protein
MSAASPNPSAPLPKGPFIDALRAELEARARLLLAKQKRQREGQSTPDDLVQETLSRLLSNYDLDTLRDRPRNQLMALAWRTMRNIVIDEGRRKAAYLEDPSPSDERGGRGIAERADERQQGADDGLAETQRAAAVRAELAALTPEERCFISTVLETDSVPAAQKKCGYPSKSPYYVLKKLFERLRGSLGEWAPA